MKKEDVKTRIQTIGAYGTVEEMRGQLATFQSDLERDYEELANLQTTIQTLNTDMENLRKANMQLFQQIGKGEDEPVNKPGQEKTQNLKYEDLFNEEGGLK